MGYSHLGEHPIRQANTLPTRGAITCDGCGKTWTDIKPHFIRRMVAAGWRISTDAPHNLCPTCAQEASR